MSLTVDNCVNLVARLREAAGLSSARRFLLALLGVGVAAHFLPTTTVRPGLAMFLLLSCLANAGRIPIHVGLGGYLWLRPSKIRKSPKPTVRKQLSALVLGNIGLVVLGLTGSTVLLAHPNAPLAWFVVPAFVYCLTFYLLALATVDRARELKLKRGTELVREHAFGRWLFKIARTGRRFPPADWALKIFDKPTPRTEPSTLTLLIAAALLFAPAATLEIEMSIRAKTAAIAAVEDFGKEEQEPGTTEPSPGPTPGSPPEGIDALPGPSDVSDKTGDWLDVVIGKTDLSNPHSQHPFTDADLPYILATLPLMAYLRQMLESQGRRVDGISLYVRYGGTVLSFKANDDPGATKPKRDPPRAR